jgi:hypothetical protein
VAPQVENKEHSSKDKPHRYYSFTSFFYKNRVEKYKNKSG